MCVVCIFSKKWRIFIFQSLKCKRLNIKSIFFRKFTHRSIFFRLIKLNEKGTLSWKVRSSHNDRSSRPEVFCKKGVLRNLTKFTWKHLCQSLSFQRLKLATLLKKRLWHRCFPVNFAKLLGTPFFQNISSSCFCNKIWLWGRWNNSIKTKMVLFLSRVFLITNVLKVVYLLSKMRLSITVGLFLQFSERFWSSKCNVSSFCVCHHRYCHCVLQ